MDERCLVSLSDAPAEYAAGTLRGGAVEEFEDHLIGCAGCQVAVSEAVLVSGALRRAAARSWVYAGAGAAAVLVLALGAALAWPVDPVRRLGAVGSPPAFEGLVVRADPDSVSTLEDRGMAAYLARDYKGAITFLDSARGERTGPGVHFFLGVSLLMQGRPGEAKDALHRAASPSANPYAEEALYYLAKAHLALGEGDGALAALARVDLTGPFGARAAALADSVRSVLP